MNKAPLLQLSNFGLERGKHFSFHNLDWSVYEDQHWCILGPNGCGKTSLLSSLTGYAPPTTGRIELFGEIYGDAEWQEVRKQVGVVSTGLLPYIEDQELAQDLVVTGREAWLTNWGPIKKTDTLQARKLLEQLGCLAIARSRWDQLSQGERQRVLIARCLMAKVKLLFLDEPWSGLDPVARNHFLDRLSTLAKTKHAPAQVLVTHHVEEIMPFCTHVLLLSKHGPVAQGLKQDILTSALLSKTYGHKVKLIKDKKRYRLAL